MLLVWRRIFFLILYFNTILISWGQVPVFRFLHNRGHVVIPFELQYNFIIVKVKVNEKYTMRFIVDTGAEYSAVNQTAADLINIKKGRKVNVMGTDHRTILIAHVGNGISLRMDDFLIDNYNVLIFPEEAPQFEVLNHLQIAGIIGADVLSRYLVKFDFKRQEMSLMSHSKTRIPKDYSNIPLMLHKNRAFVQIPVVGNARDTTQLSLLFDTGAGLPLLLKDNGKGRIPIPENLVDGKIGLGVGGYIEGTIGKISAVQLGGHTLYNVLTSFQEITNPPDSVKLPTSDGILGNDIIRLFTWYIDYRLEKCYLKPNRDFKKAPQYDKSGMTVLMSGANLNHYVVIGVFPGSPAAEADIRIGDQIITVNNRRGIFLSFNTIVKTLSKNEGETVHLKLKREGEKLYKTIVLKNIL